MIQEHLPKDEDPNEVQEWGWTIQEFVTENFWYLLAILILLALFFFARHRWNIRNRKKFKN